MGGKKLRIGEEQKRKQILRRSPRFLLGYQSTGENPSTGSGIGGNPSISKKMNNGGKISQGLKKYGSGSRRSAGSEGRANSDSENLCVVGNRVTRSSVRDVQISQGGGRRSTFANKSVKSVGYSGRQGGLGGSERPRETECVIEKRVTRSSVRENKCINNLISEFDSAGKARVSAKEGNVEVGGDSCKQTRGINIEIRVNIPYVKESEIHGANEDTNFEREARIDEKRKRCEIEEKCESDGRGWNEEQELALQKAYFTEKPTPHFWKKVARMVPGKSAEECFSRIHSHQLTPAHPQAQSRAKKKSPSSPICFSASKLLNPAKPKYQTNRRKTLMAQKTVRHLLERQQKENQNHEADFFAILEPTTNSPSLNFQNSAVFASSPSNGKPTGEISSSSLKKHRSRLNNLQTVPFVSPPVLKQIKNKALHEKYIDQLHSRDARRKANALRNHKSSSKGSPLAVKSIQSVKDSLVFCAHDVINQFRIQHVSTNNDSEIEDYESCDDENEGELRYSENRVAAL